MLIALVALTLAACAGDNGGRAALAKNQVFVFPYTLGGAANISRLEACALTRLRLVVGSEAAVNEAALQAAGALLMRFPGRTLHVVVGPNAEACAAEMRRQMAQG